MNRNLLGDKALDVNVSKLMPGIKVPSVAKDVEFRGVLVAEVDRLS